MVTSRELSICSGLKSTTWRQSLRQSIWLFVWANALRSMKYPSAKPIWTTQPAPPLNSPPKAVRNLISYDNVSDLERFCLPNIEDAKNILLDNISSGNLGKYMGDLATAWYIFLIMGGISLVLCLIYLILLRCMAKPLLYISFCLIFALLLGGGFYVYYLGDRYEEKDHTRSVMRGMGILLWILTGIYSIILLCCCTRIRLGVAIMEAASDFVRNTP